MNVKKMAAGAVMAAGLAAAGMAAALPASAAAASPAPASQQAPAAASTFRSTFGPYGSFKQCDNELTAVMSYPAYIETVSPGCFQGRGGNSWSFTVVFAGNPT